MITETNTENYYEILQLSPKAEQLVITKVYRLLAAYYHPDNKQTGNEEKFKQVIRAYEVLSDPAKRSKYNLECFGSTVKEANGARAEALKANFHTGKDNPRSKMVTLGGGQRSDESEISEKELRKHMLLALYDVRRNNPTNPELSLLVLAELLGCTIENLGFSNWYLKEKGLIKISESADFSITIAGVDYVEQQLTRLESESQLRSLPEWRH